MKEKLKIACEKIPLGRLFFQEVISITEDGRDLVNLNIILDNKIVHKIRFENDEQQYEIGVGEKIALEFINSKLSSKEKKRKTPSKVNKTAANNAAKNLFNNMGLDISK